MADSVGGSPPRAGAAASRVVYESAVTAVGGMVEQFLEHGILIFFAHNAPAELHDMSVLHRADVAEDGPEVGDVITLGAETVEVLAVGPVVRDNLLNLGHLDLKADGRSEPKLPGDVCIRTGPIPLLAPGETFRITRPAASSLVEPVETTTTPNTSGEITT